MTRLRFGLRARIMAWSFGPTMLILGAVAVYSLLTYSRVTTSLVEERNQQLTQLLAQQISVEMSRHVDQLNDLTMNREILTFDPAHQTTALRWSIGVWRTFDAGVVILDDQGRVVAADPRRPDLVGEDWSQRRFFKRLLLPTALVFASDIEDLGPQGEPVVAYSLHLTDARGRFRGAVVGMFALDTEIISDLYRSLVRSMPNADGTRTYLVDSLGLMIDPSRQVAPGLDVSSRPAVQRVLQGETGSLRTVDLWDQEIIASYAPVPDTPWGLIHEQSWRQVSAVSREYGQRLLGLLVLGLVIPPLLVAVSIKRIVRPLAQMTDAAQRIAGGALSQRIQVPEGDELADLAAALNHMSARLQSLYGRMEAEVAQRTHELKTLNAIAQRASQSLDLRGTLAAALDQTLSALDVASGLVYYRPSGVDRRESVVRNMDPEIARGILEALPAADGAPAQVRVPLVAQGQDVGVLLLCLGTERTWGQGEHDLLTAIGQQIGVAADNARLYEQAEQVAVAAERNRLARELHDSVTQTLFSANLIAGVLPLLWDVDQREGRARLEELQELTRGALAEMRMLLIELRPAALRGVSLRDLLQQLCDAVAARARLPITFRFEGVDRLPDDVRIALYRVAQEALNNAVKHAQAGALGVDASLGEGCVRVTCSDDGQGFDPCQIAAGHMGLRIMRERMATIGGDLEISSWPSQGTRITASWSAASTLKGENLG